MHPAGPIEKLTVVWTDGSQAGKQFHYYNVIQIINPLDNSPNEIYQEKCQYWLLTSSLNGYLIKASLLSSKGISNSNCIEINCIQ